MPSITPHTVAELIYWSYANLAMAHDGINRGLPTYDKTSFIIRMRLFKGLLSGKSQISSLFKDERWKKWTISPFLSACPKYRQTFPNAQICL